jgi:hypothetical protein
LPAEAVIIEINILFQCFALSELWECMIQLLSYIHIFHSELETISE